MIRTGTPRLPSLTEREGGGVHSRPHGEVGQGVHPGGGTLIQVSISRREPLAGDRPVSLQEISITNIELLYSRVYVTMKRLSLFFITL